MGTLLAGALASAGHPILACGRAPRGVRWAVIATEIYGTAAAAGWLDALDPGQCLLAAQNGVGHRERLAPLTRHGRPRCWSTSSPTR